MVDKYKRIWLARRVSALTRSANKLNCSLMRFSISRRMSSRRLEPGERIDGVVVFERPSFKEADEKLVLQFAEAGQVDRPVVLPLPFTAAVMEMHSESN